MVKVGRRKRQGKRFGVGGGGKVVDGVEEEWSMDWRKKG